MTVIERKEIPPTGILQEWVAKIGLRQQGVLMTVIRGCDGTPREDPSKDFTRALRGLILNTHCADPKDAESFIEFCPFAELGKRFKAFSKSLDHYPHHFVMHVIHAVEVIGYYHSSRVHRALFESYYKTFCKKLHVNPESADQLAERLDADEATFAKQQASSGECVVSGQ